MYIPKQWSKYSYFFCIVHVRSGYCFFEPLKRRRARDLIPSFRRVLKEIETKFGKVALLTTDDGSEFKKEFADMLAELKIKHIHDHKSYVCEKKIGQFGKTMGQLLGIGTLFLEALYLTLQKLNNTFSRGTGHAPTDVKSQTKLKPNRRLKKGYRKLMKPTEFKVGDKVRFAKKNQELTNIFYKGYGGTSRAARHENWSRQVVPVKERKVVFGLTLYKLPRQTKWRKSWELQKVATVRQLVIPDKRVILPQSLNKVKKKTPQVRVEGSLLNLVSDLGAYWKPTTERRKRKKVNYKV